MTVIDQPIQQLLNIGASEFTEQYLGIQPCLVRANDAAVGLFDRQTAQELLSDPRLPLTTVRITRQGDDVPQTRYTTTRVNLIGQQEQYVDARRIASLLGKGHTVVLGALHRFHPPLAAFARSLARQLAQPVSINAYITPEGTRGLSPHYDVQDVIVVQISGRKRWRLGPSATAHPVASQAWHKLSAGQRDHHIAAASGQQHEEVELAPGDVMYFPRGYLHAADGTADLSIHLTIALSTITYLDLLTEAVTRLAADEWTRQPWRGGQNSEPAALRDMLLIGSERLAKAAADGQLDDIAGTVLAKAWHDQPAERTPVLTHAASLVSPQTGRFRLTDQAGLAVRVNPDDSMTLKNNTAELRVPAAGRAAAQTLVSGHPVSYHEIEQQCGPAAAKLVKAMLAGGFITAVA